MRGARRFRLGLALLVPPAVVAGPALLFLAAGCPDDVKLWDTCADGGCEAGCPPDANPVTMPECAPKPPCEGKPCGASCAPPPMPGLPPGPSFCDGHGHCEPGPAPMCAPPPDPCHGLHCGALCNPQCEPHPDAGCPPPAMPMACDMAGHCSPAEMVGCVGGPPYFPCMAKVCGDKCKLCDPGDPTCMEAPIPKACDPAGVCTPMMVGCP